MQKSVISDEEVIGCKSPLVDAFVGTPQSELRCFLTGLMFVTRLPCPSWCDHHPGFLMRSMAWFPLLGFCVGVFCGCFYDAFCILWTPLISALLSCFFSNWLTGCFHEDGLGDSFDAFGGGWTKKQILDIMKDSRIGTYGSVSLILYLSAKVALIGDLGVSNWALFSCTGGGPALVGAHCVARATSAPLIYFNDYVIDQQDRKSNFYGFFANAKHILGPARVVFAVFSAEIVFFCLYGWVRAAQCAVLLAVAVAAAGTYGTAIIGGVMGDFLGATICLVELCVYLLLSANFSDAEERLRNGGVSLFVLAVCSLGPICAIHWLQGKKIVQGAC